MLTIDITTTDIRLMEVNNGKITAWASRPLEAGMFEEGIISRPQAVGDAVRQLLSSSGIKNKSVVASISSLYSLSRVISVPGAGGQPLTEKAVREATDAVMPLPPEEMYFSWQRVGGDDENHHVLAVGVPRDVVDSEMRALKTAGVNAFTLDLKTLALARAVNRPEAVALNIDSTSFDVVIVAGGSAEVLRTTAWQPEQLSVEEQAEHLGSAIELTVSYYNAHHPGSTLSPAVPLFITGKLSGDRDLVRHIEDSVENPVEPISPSLDYPEHLPVAEYAVNIGLALKRTAAPGIRLRFSLARGNRKSGDAEPEARSLPDINFLPAAYKPWRPSTRQITYAAGLIAAIGLVVPLYWLTTEAMADTSNLRQRYAGINIAMEKRKGDLAKREPLQAEIDRYDSILAMGGGFVDDIQTIKRLSGEAGVSMGPITHSGSSITFDVVAPDYVTFRNFVAALEQNGRFATPVIPPEGYPYVKGGTIRLAPKR